ncbi:Glycolate oxidase subunit GlcD [Frankia canadensis]|uniref:Glycolate oxidase subunit GlcD n=1 Tax=Frankia canadensis TaxID=1836972 RepID=A0A2I2L204_9ACTN|nr:FAD-linked oxidase C-terminal domain-containing protein [Frankia canadensis]SNQ51939.1 Glycolate oxidase subunit GlcD [Frankia canadensis]SOU59229.1 Glycolate oxidase subunit GlcD [Frankia canadensis]
MSRTVRAAAERAAPSGEAATVAEAFAVALPVGRWSSDPAVVDGHRLDRSGWVPVGRPLGVAFARDVADVQAVLRVAETQQVTVTVRGAGTGLAGGAAAGAGTVVLDVSGLNRIRELSVDDALAVVEPGVITADLDAAARAAGLSYPPDPASAAISTIGGNIATNAGGLRCAKYGVTRESVLGLDVVLPSGEVIHTGRRTVKGVAGYDLTGLFVGSEGTLGVIVGATVRLRPLPRATVTLAAFFDTLPAAVDAVTALAAAGVVPAVAELLDARTVAAVNALTGGGDPAASEAVFLLVQTDGFGADAEADVAQAVLAEQARLVRRSSDAATAQALLEARRAALPALERLGRVLIEDIAVPRSRLAEAARRVTEIGAAAGVDIYTLAHVADGNLHPIIVVDPAEPEIPPRAWAAAEQIFALALELGGTVTGEHGVGVLKRRWLAAELDPATHDLQRRLRSTLDPAGTLTPGRAL